MDFGHVTLPDNAVVFATVYNKDGQMLLAVETTLIDGKLQIAIPDTVYRDTDEVKLFIVNRQTLCLEQKEITKRNK